MNYAIPTYGLLEKSRLRFVAGGLMICGAESREQNTSNPAIKASLPPRIVTVGSRIVSCRQLCECFAGKSETRKGGRQGAERPRRAHHDTSPISHPSRMESVPDPKGKEDGQVKRLMPCRQKCLAGGRGHVPQPFRPVRIDEKTSRHSTRSLAEDDPSRNREALSSCEAHRIQRLVLL
jgi:hypothetical protein